MEFETYPESESPFRHERATYRAHARELQDRIGWFAVIRGDELAGVFRTYVKASRFAHERYGLERFMIHEIERIEDAPCPT